MLLHGPMVGFGSLQSSRGDKMYNESIPQGLSNALFIYGWDVLGEEIHGVENLGRLSGGPTQRKLKVVQLFQNL